MTAPLSWHQRLNRETRSAGDWFSTHRQRLTELLLNHSGSLALLGAGNCNDVDLSSLAQSYSSIRLFDIDEESPQLAVAKLPVEAHSRVSVTATDLSGLQPTLAAAKRTGKLPQAADIASDLARALDIEPCQTVASCCLLSQVIDGLARQLGPKHPRLLDMVVLMRSIHLELMLALLAPGGRGFLVSDMVSSDTVPNLSGRSPQELPELMFQLVQAHNFFTGLNPYLIRGQLQQAGSFSAACSNTTLYRPWLWRLGPKRSYLVFAIGFDRA